MMNKTLVAVIFATAAAVLHDDHGIGGGTVKPLSSREIAEKLDGKKTKATTVEVTLEPGQASPAHVVSSSSISTSDVIDWRNNCSNNFVFVGHNGWNGVLSRRAM